MPAYLSKRKGCAAGDVFLHAMTNRRSFLKQSAAASTGVFYIAKTSWAQKSPGDTINVAVGDSAKNIAANIERVTADHDYTIITREGGKPAAVLMSLEDFASWQETDYLLRSPANRAELLASIAEADAGRVVVRDLIE